MGEKEGRRTEGKDERQEETERDTKCRWRVSRGGERSGDIRREKDKGKETEGRSERERERKHSRIAR